MVEVGVNSEELTKLLAQLGARAGNLSAGMAIAGEELVAGVNDQFETSGDGTWPPLAGQDTDPPTSTWAARLRAGKTDGPLKFNGGFAGSVHREYDGTSAGAYASVEYAVYHCSDAPRTIIPYRNPFDEERLAANGVLERAQRAIIDSLVRDFSA